MEHDAMKQPKGKSQEGKTMEDKKMGKIKVRFEGIEHHKGARFADNPYDVYSTRMYTIIRESDGSRHEIFGIGTTHDIPEELEFTGTKEFGELELKFILDKI